MSISKTAKVLVTIAALAVAVLMSVVLGGCTGSAVDEEETVSVAAVAGDVANMPLPSAHAAEEYVERCAETQGYFDVIVPDGKAFSAIEGPVQLGSVSPDENRRALENEALVATCVEAMSNATARSEETDLLAAIGLAKRSLAQATGSKLILVFHSGISTAGAIRTSELLGANPEEACEYAKGELPDLSGVSVIWIGFGDVAEPQAKPAESVKKNQEAIWAALLKEAGASSVEFRDDPPSGKPPSSALDVTPVEFPAPPTPPQGDAKGAYELPSAVLQFEPDSAEFSDPGAASDAIGPFVDALVKDQSLQVNVVGQTASYPWDRNYALQLSQQRAQAVATALADAGVDPSRIMATGIGDTRNEDRDIDPETGLQTPLSTEFRKVTIEIY